MEICPTSAAADLPQPEDKLIIIPCLFSIISGTKWRSTFAVPLIFVSTTISKSSAGTFHVLLFLFIVPALFTVKIPSQNPGNPLRTSIWKGRTNMQFHNILHTIANKQKVQTYNIWNLLPFHNSFCQLSHTAVRPLHQKESTLDIV